MANVTLNGNTSKVSEDKLKKIEAIINEKEPKIRHGDYGYYEYLGSMSGRIFTQATEHTTIRGYDNNGVCVQQDALNAICNYTLLGNIFDDLKRMREGLEEFEMRSKNYNGAIEFKLGHSHNGHSCYCDKTSPTMIWINPKKEGWFSLDEAADLHQKLGQVIATAKRDKQKDC